MRRAVGLIAAIALAACSSSAAPIDPTAGWTLGDGPRARVTGKAFVFGPTTDYSVVGATIAVAERESIASTIAADGTFALDVPTGAPFSLIVRQPDFHPTQSATFAPSDLVGGALDQVGFQVPTEGIFDLMASFVKLDPDPSRCQIATTVSRKGTEPFGGSGLGEPDVTVSIDPKPPSDVIGPVYFAYVNNGVILPDPSLTATTIDGGVLFGNVPPGEYVLTATKSGKRFTTATIRCRAGVLVNAAPPRGLQEL